MTKRATFSYFIIFCKTKSNFVKNTVITIKYVFLFYFLKRETKQSSLFSFPFQKESRLLLFSYFKKHFFLKKTVFQWISYYIKKVFGHRFFIFWKKCFILPLCFLNIHTSPRPKKKFCRALEGILNHFKNICFSIFHIKILGKSIIQIKF